MVYNWRCISREPKNTTSEHAWFLGIKSLTRSSRKLSLHLPEWGAKPPNGPQIFPLRKRPDDRSADTTGNLILTIPSEYVSFTRFHLWFRFFYRQVICRRKSDLFIFRTKQIIWGFSNENF